MRLDKYLFIKQFVSSRSRAEELIRDNGVLVNGVLIKKSSFKVDANDRIELVASELKYVSKGALKLKKAIEYWNLKLDNLVFIDLGASTGGFTEVLLENKVSKVYAVDVGSDQLHKRIKSNEKVINLEKTHVKKLTSELISQQVEGVVIDVSFISCMKVLKFLIPFLKPNAIGIILIKPQFELGSEALNKNGVVKDSNLFEPLIEKITNHYKSHGLEIQGVIDSPILGGNGNKEFLAYFCAR